MRDLIGILLVAVVLLAMSWAANSSRLYFPGGYGSLSLNSCYVFVAGALVIIATMCTVLRVGPGEVPKTTIHWVFGSIMAVVTVGIFSGWFNTWQYAARNPGEQIYIDWFNDVVGFLAFGLVFGGTLYLPYFSHGHVGETRCRRCDHILRGLKEPRCPECGEAI